MMRVFPSLAWLASWIRLALSDGSLPRSGSITGLLAGSLDYLFSNLLAPANLDFSDTASDNQRLQCMGNKCRDFFLVNNHAHEGLIVTAGSASVQRHYRYSSAARALTKAKEENIEVTMTPRILYGFCFALLALLGQPVVADQDDPRLDELFSELKSTEDPAVALVIAEQIWDIWLTNDNPEYFELMVSGIRHMNANALNLALDDFNRLIAIAPNYAEAWNKRATVYYLLQNFAASAADIDKTLALEPFHFGAMSGLGLVRIGEGRYLEARHAFQRVLEVYPAMLGIRQNLEQLENFLQNNSI